MNDIELKNVSYKYPLSEAFALKDFHFTFKKESFMELSVQTVEGKPHFVILSEDLFHTFTKVIFQERFLLRERMSVSGTANYYPQRSAIFFKILLPK